MIRRLIKKTLNTFGYDLHRIGPEESRWEAGRIREYVPSINTCIDVGVGFGTPTLYRAFPDAFHVLVEPLVDFEPFLKDILSDYQGAYFLTAAGECDGTMSISVEQDTPLKTTFLERTGLTRATTPAEQRQVPITTLDNLFKKHDFDPPFGLKIDTEGFEMQVVKGARKVLLKTAFVIAEVSYAKRFQGGYEFSEFTQLMSENGFFLKEILQIAGASGQPTLYFDSLFLRSSPPL